MNLIYQDDRPIIACSTSTLSNAAIAIIRIGGFDSLIPFQFLFSRELKQIRPRKVYHSDLLVIDEEIHVVDSILFVYFEGPSSYNGENILELYVHGNKLNIDRILNIFVSSELVRHAHPGEFTYRGLKNKKFNLSQVEGLDLFLNAHSTMALTQGQALIHGRLFENYNHLHQAYLNLKSAVELSIDFLEDIGDEAAEQNYLHSLTIFEEIVESLYKKTEGSLGSILSPDIVIIGQTNAGKSSLFNFLLKTHRSIVSPQAGTTRDYVSEYLYMKGTHFKLIDTAGVRESKDLIEKEGIDRAWQMLDHAFFKILVLNPFETDRDYIQLFSRFDFDLTIFTHFDHPQFRSKKEELLSWGPLPFSKHSMDVSLISGPIGPARKSGPIGPASLEDDHLVENIGNFIFDEYQELIKDDPIVIQRHRDLIKEIYNAMHLFKKETVDENDIGIISHQLRSIGHHVENLIGIVNPEEVLTSIFNNFCIGK